MTDTLTLIGTIAGSGGLGAIVARYAVPPVARVVRHWIKGRAQVAASEAEARAAEAEREEREADRAWHRLDKVERRLEDCEGHRAECLDALRETQGDLRETRAHVGRLAERLGELLSERGESTGLHEVLDIAASNTPIPGPPPLPTMLPPAGGESEE